MTTPQSWTTIRRAGGVSPLIHRQPHAPQSSRECNLRYQRSSAKRSVALLGLLLLSLPLLAPTFAEEPAPPAPSPTPEGQHDILYLGEKRPFVLRLEITYDGVPYRTAWEQFLDERFLALDVNHDGELDREEKEALKQLRMLMARPPAQSRSVLLQRNPLAGNPKRSDLGLYFKQMGWLPLALAPANAQPQRGVPQAGSMRQQAGFDQAGAILFKQIDSDGDQVVTRAEIENARHALRKFDLDHDESISRSELVPGLSLGLVFGSGQAMPELPASFVDLSENTAGGVVSKLLSKYCKPERDVGDRQLSRSQIGFPESLFARFDGDGNGTLDGDELLAFLKQPEPDAIIIARLGKTEPGVARLEVQSRGEQCKASLQADGAALVSFENTDLDIMVEPPPALPDLTARLEQVIAGADGDKNGYVGRNESGSLGPLAQRFAELDVDGDGQLFPKEFVQVMLPAALVADRQLRVGVGGSAVDLFLAIDRDQDSRISAREFRELPALIATWDQNGDGSLDADEVPRRFRLQIGIQEFLPRSGQPARVIVNRNGNASPAGARATLTATSPAWFIRMDRNGDGEVSRREFLGTRDDFNKMDQDRDDLLSSAEAAAISP